jgi:tetratricopeptide (TPR) repeat protein
MKPTLRYVAIFAAVILTLGGAGALFLPNSVFESAPDQSPRYVGSQKCASCHQNEFGKWRSSHHAHSMEKATKYTVKGNFDEQSFIENGVETRFFMRDDRFFVNTEGADGESTDFEVKYTFGYEPLQQYLIEVLGGGIQCLTIVWNVKDRRWYSLLPKDAKIKAGESEHWTGSANLWNAQCAKCHSTDFKKNFDVKTGRYTTQYSELSVGCEACHGPASKHLNWLALSRKNRKKDQSKGFDRSLQNNSAGDFQSCVACHSRRHQVSPDLTPEKTDSFDDHYMAEPLRPGLYFPDGQAKGEVYVFGSFVQSKMYQAGVSCKACHDLHSGELTRPGNALCTQCHNPKKSAKSARYPSLVAKNYNSNAHHFHDLNKPGASCVSCHMPVRTIMGIDKRHDHSFRVPRPDLTERVGVPNTCNQCHTKKSASWAADKMVEWYGEGPFKRPSFAIALAAGADAHPLAIPSLLKVVRDLKQPAVARAAAVEHLGQYGDEALHFVCSLLQSPDPMIRVSALRALSRLDLARREEFILPLLTDDSRAVRVEAVPLLAALPLSTMSDTIKDQFKKALDEYEAMQRFNSDLATGPFNLAVVYDTMKQRDIAIVQYRRAIAINPRFLPAVFNLAALLRVDRPKEAEKVLRQASKIQPKNGEIYYSLGLFLSEFDRKEEAEQELAKAARYLPGRPRVLFNYALLLQKLKKYHEAEVPLRQAQALNPKDSSLLQALVVLLIEMDRWGQAKQTALELLKLDPKNPQFQELLAKITQDMKDAGH